MDNARAGTAGYFDSPWPCEDGGPARPQAPRRGRGLGLRDGERLRCTVRATHWSTMTVLGAPGEVFLLVHEALRARLGLATRARVERIDPLSLRPLRASPPLAGGPMWPGGLAVHRCGDLHAVYGRHAHRLDRDCVPLASFEFPVDEPYNSFVVLDDGTLVAKNLSRTTPARLTALDPTTLRPRGPDTVCPEPSVARLGADGGTVYVIGVRSVFRYAWDGRAGRLREDERWRLDYVGASGRTHGWDAVLAGGDAWFMDNGHHRYVRSMVGAGVSRTSNRLLRVSLRDAADHAAIEVCGVPGGSVTNPPLVDPDRGIVVGYDSANRHLRAWRILPGARGLRPLWHRAPFGAASHMVLYPDTGEMVVNDWRRGGEEVVVLDVERGIERGRVRVGGLGQGVVFPSAGWGRDLYWSTMSRLARVFVE